METEMSGHLPFPRRRHQTLATATPMSTIETEMPEEPADATQISPRRRHRTLAAVAPMSTIEIMSGHRPFPRRRHQTLPAAATPISTIETDNSEDQTEKMFGHRSTQRFISVVSSQKRSAPSRSGAIRISTGEADRRPKRSLPASSAVESSGPVWTILNRVGARKDRFRGDGTTSAVSRTSTGEEISVSFVFVEPPGTSILTLDWARGPDPMKSTLSYPNVIAAHRGAVLFDMTSRSMYPSAPDDYFVYQASSDPSQPSSLFRLPLCHDCKGNSSADRPQQRIMSRRGTGLLSWSTNSFIVAELETSSYSPPTVDIYMFWSGPASQRWEIIPRVHIHCAKDQLDISWWSTDAVLAFRNCYLVWVDYYRGMIFGNMGEGRLPRKLDLHYVPLPVDPIRGNPDDSDYGRGCPEASRSVCVAADGTLKFVIVNRNDSSFSISMWSLLWGCNTWIKEATLDADQLWALDSGNCFPHVRPEFPVVNMKNPEAVCFLLNKDRHSADPGATTCMIEVHMKEQRLLEVTYYTKEVSLSNENSYMTARMMSEGCSFISSELPFYLAEHMKRMKR